MRCFSSKMKCKDCENLIKRYGYCQIAEEWVEQQLNVFSFDVGVREWNY